VFDNVSPSREVEDCHNLENLLLVRGTIRDRSAPAINIPSVTDRR